MQESTFSNVKVLVLPIITWVMYRTVFIWRIGKYFREQNTKHIKYTRDIIMRRWRTFLI